MNAFTEPTLVQYNAIVLETVHTCLIAIPFIVLAVFIVGILVREV